MNIANIKWIDIANGEGCRTSIFVSGCRHHCKNCFNEIAWDFNYGKPYTLCIEEEIIDFLSNFYIHGLSILGGEPFEPENQKDLLRLTNKIKFIYPDKTIWCYTGFTFEQLIGNSRAKTIYTNKLLSNIDVLVDGPFIQDLADISLKFKGSSNQRIIDIQKTLMMKEIKEI